MTTCRPASASGGQARQAGRFVALAVACLLLPLSVTAQRTITPNEYGGFFAWPPKKANPQTGVRPASTPGDGDWSSFGCYVGLFAPHYMNCYRRMTPDALKVPLGRFLHFASADEHDLAMFPYDELKAFESSEVAAGRDPIFVTATYAGKKRPVYFFLGLGAPRAGSPPKRGPSFWTQALNLHDDRVIDFWINQYARKVLPKDIPNMWMGVDNCMFAYSVYGVLDDSGNWVPNVRWDRPFAQNQDEFLQSVEYFFRRIKALAPEILIMCNMDQLPDWSKFPEAYADVPGIMKENIFYDDARPAVRLKEYNEWTAIQWLASKNRVALLRADVPAGDKDRMVSALITYLILRGPSFFFSPVAKKSSLAIPPEDYMPVRTALGDPVGPPQSQKESGGQNDGYRLYWRRCANGLVYLNETGKTLDIKLPTDRTYYSREGHPVTTIQVGDLKGDYVLNSPPQ
jgi:hypothetical protein